MSGVIDAPIGYEKITGLIAVKGFTVATFKNANVAVIRAEGQAIRFRDDGTDPTVAEGMRLPADETYEFTGDLSKFKAIELAVSATLFAQFYFRGNKKI